MPSEFRIRDASAADLPAIAEIHASSWRAAYRGILADAFLDGDLLQDRKTRWAGIAERMQPRDNLLIAMDGEGAVGFIAGWASAALGCDDGYGYRQLACATRAARQQYGSRCFARWPEAPAGNAGNAVVRIWLLDGNASAHRFYHRLGGRDGGVSTIESAERGRTRIMERFQPCRRLTGTSVLAFSFLGNSRYCSGHQADIVRRAVAANASHRPRSGSRRPRRPTRPRRAAPGRCHECAGPRL